MARPRKSSAPEYARWRGNVLWAKFQYSDELRETACDLYGVASWPPLREWSLETNDPLLAKHKLQDEVKRHLELRLIHRAHHSNEFMGTIDFRYKMEPGTRETHADGSITIATDKVIMHLGPDGLPRATDPTEPNDRRLLVNFNETGERTPEFRALMKLDREIRAERHKDPDREAIETYCAKKRKDDVTLVWTGVDGVKNLTGSKPLSLTRKGEVRQFIDEEIARRATDDNPLKGFERVMRMIKLCSAALNAHVNDNPTDSQYDQGRNPFAGHPWKEIGKGYQPKVRPPTAQTDLEKIKARADKFTRQQYLMIAMHFGMSVRPIGLASIVRDEWVEEDEYDDDAQLIAQHRTRVVYIERDKNHHGVRRIPIPQCLLDAKWTDGTPLLPEKIEGRLFPNENGLEMNDEERGAFLVQINNKLDQIGIKTTLYSARHRARQRLNGCKDDQIRKLIMGHEKKIDPHNQYGGYRAFEIKPWIDIIRF